MAMATTFNSVEQRVNDLLAPPVFNEDDTISKELLKLSLKERNALEEEIHGVRSLNPDETPHLVDRSLRDFDQKLLLVAEERQRTREKKILTLHGFDNSECFKSNDVLRNVRRIYQNCNGQKSKITIPPLCDCYVNDPAIRLVFLRGELFDVEKAVRRFINFLELTSELFGDFVAHREIRITDFRTPEERTALRNSRQQMLPFRDRSGRQVFVCIGDCGTGLPAKLRFKIRMMLFWTTTKDIQTQRKGLVFICWPSSEILSKLSKSDLLYRQKFMDARPVRFVSWHICCQDTPMCRAIGTLWVVSSRPDVRVCTKVHIGGLIETQYMLHGFGIPLDIIPLSHTGTIKTANHIQWINALHYKLQEAEGGEEIVICPGFHDVLSRKGQRYASHPGNMKFRELVQSMSDLHERVPRTQKFQVTQSVLFKVEILGGRFLEWKSPSNVWIVTKDRKSIHAKIAFAFREIKRRKRLAAQKTRTSNGNFNDDSPDLNREEVAGSAVDYSMQGYQDQKCFLFCRESAVHSNN